MKVLKLWYVTMLCWSSYLQACELRFAFDTPFPPHIILDTQRYHGLNIQLFEALAAEVGCQVRFVKSPWARALRLVQQGQIDVISQLSLNPERAKDLAFIGPHLQERMWFIADPALFPSLRTINDLAEQAPTSVIAVLNGGYYGPKFASLKKNPAFLQRLFPILSNEDKLALLESGRVQAVLEEELAWLWRTRTTKTPYQPLLLVHDNPVYFGINKHSVSSELRGQLAEAWQKLYQTGRLQIIRASYFTSSEPQAQMLQQQNLQLSQLPSPNPVL